MTLRHRVQVGARILVPFGTRNLTGLVVAVHNDAAGQETKEALRLIDEQPVLDEELLALGRWIAGYYCAPPGEVLRSMLPLSAEIRAGKNYSLTDAGRDAARQLQLGDAPDDAPTKILALLERRALSAAYLKKKLPQAAQALRSLEKRGFVEASS